MFLEEEQVFLSLSGVLRYLTLSGISSFRDITLAFWTCRFDTSYMWMGCNHVRFTMSCLSLATLIIKKCSHKLKSILSDSKILPQLCVHDWWNASAGNCLTIKCNNMFFWMAIWEPMHTCFSTLDNLTCLTNRVHTQYVHSVHSVHCRIFHDCNYCWQYLLMTWPLFAMVTFQVPFTLLVLGCTKINRIAYIMNKTNVVQSQRSN
jgi:hypothetical protein